MTYREFVDHMKAATTEQVRLIRGERDVLPFLHLCDMAHQVVSIGLEAEWFASDVRKQELIEGVVLPYAEVVRPVYVGWTFTGRRGAPEGEFDHETAVALCIERERHETWLARLVRHDDRASLGAWRPWPANQQEGRMLTTIQEAMR